VAWTPVVGEYLRNSLAIHYSLKLKDFEQANIRGCAIYFTIAEAQVWKPATNCTNLIFVIWYRNADRNAYVLAVFRPGLFTVAWQHTCWSAHSEARESFPEVLYEGFRIVHILGNC
jgi:hypothetical protein